jgi:hypothetical protein
MEQMEKKRLEMIINDALRALHIVGHIGLTRRSYKNNAWNEKDKPGSKLRWGILVEFSLYGNMCHKSTRGKKWNSLIEYVYKVLPQ